MKGGEIKTKMFLETLAMNVTSTGVSGSSALLGGGIFAAIMGMLAVVSLISIAMYIYTSFAYMAMAKKAKQSSPGLAWIPGIGPIIIAFQASKMHWWPWLLLGVSFLMFMPIIPQIAGLTFFIFFVIWRWKLMEEIKKPGWWSLLMIIPIVNLIIMGIAAWSKD